MLEKSKTILIETIDLHKTFRVGDQDIEVLKGVNLKVNSGDFLILLGPSGCGKSTLLHTLLGLERPTSGHILFEGKDYFAMTPDERAYLRKHKVGIIYQQSVWVKALNVLENVAFPLRLLGLDEAQAKEKASKMIEQVGMDQWASHFPTELSAGQQQKISLARCLVIDPLFIAADEPTGNLDTVSGQELMETLLKLNHDGRTIVMITHDLGYLNYATNLCHMIDGQIVAEKKLNGDRRKIIDKKSYQSTSESNIRDPQFVKSLFNS